MEKHIPAKRNPLMKGLTGLDFTGLSEEETIRLTDAQKADAFLSKWMQVMDPVAKYSRYFDELKVAHDLVLRQIKNFYLKYVVRGAWSEHKYVVVVDSILINKFSFSQKTFEGREILFNEERLEAQLLEKRLKRRRRL